MAPSVSIILPTFNVWGLTEEAVASVMAQTFDDWELIVIDDGSTDGTADQLLEYADDRISLIRHTHTGNPGRLRNHAVARSSAALVAFIDSDDLWEARKLELQLSRMAAAPDCDWSYTATMPINEVGEEILRSEAQEWEPYSGWILPHLLTIKARVPASSVVVKRAALAAVGGFDPEAGPVEDYDLWFRLAPRFRALAIPERLCRSRSRAGSYQADRVAAHRAWQRAYSKVQTTNESGSVRRTCQKAIHRHQLDEAFHLAIRGDRRRAVARMVRVLPHAVRLGIGWAGILRTLMALCRRKIPADRRQLSTLSLASVKRPR